MGILSKTQIIAYVKNTLGLGQIAIEATDTAIGGFVDQGLTEVQNWYEEFTLETVEFTSGPNQSCFFDVSGLSKTFSHIINIYDVNRLRRNIIDVQRQLLGLDASIIDLTTIMEFAAWRMVRPQITTVLGAELAYKYIEPNIYVARPPSSDVRMSVEYAYLVEDAEDMRYVPANVWLRDYTLAMTRIAVGEIRSKYSGGGLNFQLNGSELIQKGNADLEKLMESLKKLQYRGYIVR